MKLRQPKIKGKMLVIKPVSQTIYLWYKNSSVTVVSTQSHGVYFERWTSPKARDICYTEPVSLAYISLIIKIRHEQFFNAPAFITNTTKLMDSLFSVLHSGVRHSWNHRLFGSDPNCLDWI